VYIGLVSQEIQGTRQIFAFLNYDVLSKLVKTPENDSYDAIFCRNENTQIYPIADANPNSTLKWATVDELMFEQKILEESVDPNIAELFSKQYNLWNIEDSNGVDILFPFVVYGVELNAENKFQTVVAGQSTGEEDPFALNGKIENYGADEMHDEYADRYCFTIKPIDNNPSAEHPVTEPMPEQPMPEQPVTESAPQHTSEQTGGSSNQPRRYVMFAWKTRYVIDDADKSVSEEDSADVQTGGSLSEEDSSNIALAKLQFPTIYTISKSEFTNDQPIVTWGILNPTQFVGL